MTKRSPSLIGDIIQDKYLKDIQNIKDNLFKNLKKREKKVLILRFGLDDITHRSMTLEEVGDIMGLTRERIRQIQTKTQKRISSSDIFSLYFKGINKDLILKVTGFREEYLFKRIKEELFKKLQYLKRSLEEENQILKERCEKDKEQFYIEDLQLSKRTKVGLLAKGYKTINELEYATRQELLALTGFGNKSFNEIYDLSRGLGFNLGGKIVNDEKGNINIDISENFKEDILCLDKNLLQDFIKRI